MQAPFEVLPTPRTDASIASLVEGLVGLPGRCTGECHNAGGDFDPNLKVDAGEIDGAAWRADMRRKPKGLISYAANVARPLQGPPLRAGEVWHLPPDEVRCFRPVLLSLHANGISIKATNSSKASITVAWSPFSMVQACRLHSEQADNARPMMRLFKVSVFHHGITQLFAIEGAHADTERARWVADIACALRVLTKSLFPPYRLSVQPVQGASWTTNRLLAGYMLMCDGHGVSVVYCELHAHWDAMAAFIAYEDEYCDTRVIQVGMVVSTSISERVGVDCSCFIVDTYHFCTRTSIEKAIWLRAISNVKVKLRHCPDNPSSEEMKVYRQSIHESTKDLGYEEGYFTQNPLLPRRPTGSPQVPTVNDQQVSGPPPPKGVVAGQYTLTPRQQSDLGAGLSARTDRVDRVAVPPKMPQPAPLPGMDPFISRNHALGLDEMASLARNKQAHSTSPAADAAQKESSGALDLPGDSTPKMEVTGPAIPSSLQGPSPRSAFSSGAPGAKAAAAGVSNVGLRLAQPPSHNRPAPSCDGHDSDCDMPPAEDPPCVLRPPPGSTGPVSALRSHPRMEMSPRHEMSPESFKLLGPTSPAKYGSKGGSPQRPTAAFDLVPSNELASPPSQASLGVFDVRNPADVLLESPPPVLTARSFEAETLADKEALEKALAQADGAFFAKDSNGGLRPSLINASSGQVQQASPIAKLLSRFETPHGPNTPYLGSEASGRLPAPLPVLPEPEALEAVEAQAASVATDGLPQAQPSPTAHGLAESKAENARGTSTPASPEAKPGGMDRPGTVVAPGRPERPLHRFLIKACSWCRHS
eukprot:TRINITY_DN2492_c0_g1_i1.p1 TRINITY_DN2492_c0_g1~~TRINITY_DN2492_c0_g1_i1.p1  ORF type:complete len:815 (+),score=135.92 TRINITY_DN2492_c0_g1_i1:67-2511(+)